MAQPVKLVQFSRPASEAVFKHPQIILRDTNLLNGRLIWTLTHLKDLQQLTNMILSFWREVVAKMVRASQID